MLDFVVCSLCILGICMTVQGHLHFIRRIGGSVWV